MEIAHLGAAEVDVGLLLFHEKREFFSELAMESGSRRQ